jgi:hypothetical protein
MSCAILYVRSWGNAKKVITARLTASMAVPLRRREQDRLVLRHVAVNFCAGTLQVGLYGERALGRLQHPHSCSTSATENN